jgi:hypothetical protein
MYDRDFYDYEYDSYAPAWTDKLTKHPNTLTNNFMDCGFILVFLFILPFLIFALILTTLHQIWQDKDLLQ